ncbi:putative dioxygenase subunit beta YeaX [Aspergillus awamori]|uniref:Putative dioxygenase subunit beta YeaX n=1 Tax=Aspergillus awamori TaxID=105351 RepID=A0A401L3W1_ASPAW|nr:putative dioxygenase subunit beta YeaX [Aspergillus awamori]
MTNLATSTPSPRPTATFSYANMFTVGTLYAASALHAELPRLLGISPDWAMASFKSARAGLSVGLSKAAALIDRHGAPRVAGRGAMLMTGLSLQYASFASIIAAFFLGGIGVGWTYLDVVITVSQALPHSLVHLHQAERSQLTNKGGIKWNNQDSKSGSLTSQLPNRVNRNDSHGSLQICIIDDSFSNIYRSNITEMTRIDFTSPSQPPLIPIPPPTTLQEIRTSKLRPFGPVLSAIDKQTRSGQLYVSTTGLEDDEHDLTFHGGIDKAIHQYCADHYSFWADRFPEARARFIPGGFGENLIADGWNEQTVCIGDRVRIGPPDSLRTGGRNGCVLEVSLPRQPCFKLNQRFGIKNFAPLTHQEAKTGWYYRVVEEGWIQEGMEIRVIHRSHPRWSIARLHHYVHRDKTDVAATQHLMAMEVLGDECKDVFINRWRAHEEKEAAAKRPPETWRQFRVVSHTAETPRIVRLELEAVRRSAPSPSAILPGSHARLKLPSGLRRAYSIVHGDTDRFTLGVALDERSRGGSSYIHQTLKQGDTVLVASEIRQGLAIDNMASHHIFIAGGIGITALIAMMNRLKDTNQDYSLHYAVRSITDIAFQPLLTALQPHVTIYDKSQGQRLDIAKILRNRIWNSHVYVCGPQRMIDAVIQTAADVDMSSDEVHYELFNGEDAGGDPFTVDVVGRNRKSEGLQVGAEQSLLEVVRDAGFEIGSSSLMESEQRSEMLACVSRGAGHIVIEVGE